jgi:hypothetical protein
MEEWQAGEWEGRESCPLKEGVFLIGNHADEMTVSRWRKNPSIFPAMNLNSNLVIRDQSHGYLSSL